MEPDDTRARSSRALSISVDRACVRFLIRYHDTTVTLGETITRSMFPWRRGPSERGRWKQTFWALRDVSFTARPGEIIGVIGRNGSGKSTLLKVLAQIIGPDRGEVKVKGRVACVMSFGVAFNPELTGFENIYVCGNMLGLSRDFIDSVSSDIVEFSELDEFIEAPVRTYSNGMKVRLGFSIAVHIEPDVLLLDEVLTAGDEGFQRKSGSIIEHLRGSEQTIVMASHDIETVQRVCDRVIWLDRGRVCLDGDPATVCEAYAAEIASPGSFQSESPEPSIRAVNASIRYLIRYHNAAVTVRETFTRSVFPRRADANERGQNWRRVFSALSNISFTAYPGEVIGVIGRNGSGKTTLLKLLAGIIGPDRGSVSVKGQVNCLMTFGVGFNADLTGRENIYLSGSMLGLSKRKIYEVIDEIVAFTEIGEFMDAPVRTYSSGMKVRLGFSIAIHMSPDVLLLDEVLAAGDKEFRAKSGSIIEHLGSADQTVVIAGHDMWMLEQACNRVIWLDRGQIRMEGEPKVVCEAYRSHMMATASPTLPAEAPSAPVSRPQTEA